MTLKGDSHGSKVVLAGAVRRLAVLLLALALPALAWAGVRDPQERFTPADQAKAKALLLTRADLLSGWKQAPPTPDDEDVTCGAFDPDLSDLVLTADQEVEFEHAQAGASVYSHASLFKSAAQANAAWSRVMKPALTRCLTQVIREAVGANVKVTFSKVGRVPYPRLAPRVYALEVNCTISSEETGKSLAISMDVVQLGRGRADVSVMTIGLGKGIPNKDVRVLATVLARRLAAAKL